MIKRNTKFNEEMLNSKSPCGYEKESVKVFESYMSELSLSHLFTDSMWNSVFYLGEKPNTENVTTILIEGHIDSCSFMVSNITDSGFLHVIRQGGADVKTMYSHQFEVLTRDGKSITAFCPKKAIHLEKQSERSNMSLDIKDLVLDCGCDSAKEVKDLGIQVGDLVVYKNTGLNLEFGTDGKYLVGQNLDDKAAILCIYEIASSLVKLLKYSESKLKNYSICFACTTQEEVGLRGATNLAKKINPDYSISIDCTHAVCREIGGDPSTLNSIELGKGPVINFSPSSFRELSLVFQKVAELEHTQYQLQATGAGGTNTGAIQLESDNCKTILISYPMTGMHTPTEKVCWDDLHNLCKLIQDWIDRKVIG